MPVKKKSARRSVKRTAKKVAPAFRIRRPAVGQPGKTFTSIRDAVQYQDPNVLKR